MKEQKEIKEGYVNNAELKKLISRYNELNIDDTGEWISRYITKMNKKKDLKSIGPLVKVDEYSKVLGLIIEVCTFPTRYEWVLSKK